MKEFSVIDSARSGEISFSNPELERYARHITIPDVGLEGQKRLKAASVLCIGAGGLGSPVLIYLAAAGVGRIGIVDFDVVDRSNLQRQILHRESSIGTLKLDSAKTGLLEINPHLELVEFPERLTSENAREIADSFDVIIDGTDNFPTRYLSNDLAVLTRKPNVYGSIYRFEGQVSVFAPHLEGPCYRCLFPTPPDPGTVPSCAEGGVLGVLPGIIGSLQALEAIKLILGKGDVMTGRLMHFDALRFKFREIRLRRDPECPVCGDQPTVTDLIDYEAFCNPTMSNPSPPIPEVSVQDLKARVDSGDAITIIDVREPDEHSICNLEQARLIPLAQVGERLEEIPREGDVYVHCKLGGRSAKAVNLLRSKGYENVHNVAGGITAWAKKIDTSMPTY